jgi:hypothetical protein
VRNARLLQTLGEPLMHATRRQRPVLPTADHYPRLQMHGGLLTRDNVRLAHRCCNQRDHHLRKKIGELLLRRRSLQEIAAELNAKKVPLIPGTNRWTAARVRKAFVS